MKKPIIRLSSLSHKYVIALAGMFLMLFLCFHLATNLLMLAGDGGDSFGKAVGFLDNNPLVKVMEYVLFAGFIIHILFGVVIWFLNRKARPVRYRVAPRSETSWFSKFMIHTGLLIFIFLCLHLFHFFLVKLELVGLPEYASHTHDFYAMAVVLFQTPWVSVIYLISFVFLTFHLTHAFQAAFQSLGLNHHKYTPVIKVVGTLYALLIGIGFALIPLYFLFIY